MITTINELQPKITERRKKKSAITYNNCNIHYNIFADFKKSLYKIDLSDGFKYNLTQHMKYFLTYLEKENIENISNITMNNILNYLNSIDYDNLITLKNSYYLFKYCLTFLYKNKYIDYDFSIYIPKINVVNNSTIPTAWDKNTLNKLLSNVDACPQTEKRTYLTLILSITYGLRISDIKKMKFSDLDWNNRQIKVVQRKTKKEVIFPMTKVFISALVDYVKNERPKSEYDNIIVGRHGELLAESNHFYRQMQLIFKKADIDYKNKKVGIHSMRHSFASELLKENIPLPIISSILGHSNTSVTTMYLKIDKTQLVKCCLSLKEVQLNDI